MTCFHVVYVTESPIIEVRRGNEIFLIKTDIWWKSRSRFPGGASFGCQSLRGWITEDFSLMCYKRWHASKHHQPECPNGQLGRQGYRRNPVGQEIICHGRADINKDGWCVAISFHCSTAEPLKPIQRPSEIDWCFCTRGAKPLFLDPPPTRQLTVHNISLQKENFNGNYKKVTILSSISYRFIKKILFFFSSDLLPPFFLLYPCGLSLDPRDYNNQRERLHPPWAT